MKILTNDSECCTADHWTAAYRTRPISTCWHGFTVDVVQTWNAPQHADLYLPLISWHARVINDKEKNDLCDGI